MPSVTKSFMKNFLTLIIISLFSVSAYAQSDTISTAKKGLGIIYKINDQPIKMSVFERMIKGNEAAAGEYRKWRNNKTATVIFSYAGAGLIAGAACYSVGSHKDINIKTVGAGAVLLCVALPFNTAANRHLRRAVHIYNAAIHK